MGFFRQEYWSGLPFPSPGDLPDPGIEPLSLTPALAGRFFTISPPGKHSQINNHLRNSLAVQWLGLGTEIPQAAWHSKKKEKEEEPFPIFNSTPFSPADPGEMCQDTLRNIPGLI